MITMGTIAIAIPSNLAFITYGTIEWLPPVLVPHLVLLPLNIVRLAEVIRATRSASDLPQASRSGDCCVAPARSARGQVEMLRAP